MFIDAYVMKCCSVLHLRGVGCEESEALLFLFSCIVRIHCVSAIVQILLNFRHSYAPKNLERVAIKAVSFRSTYLSSFSVISGSFSVGHNNENKH